ncbi:WG repeat-containing protein [Cytophagaceae bacterium ABcell3]|nr:WG repeat-containing protein [Cytophagaceae bacterium ABcell3]
MKFFFVAFLAVVINFQELSAQEVYSEGLAPKEADDLWGFVNKKGVFVIQPSYDSIYQGFRHGMAVVGNGNMRGVVDKKGRLIVPIAFTDINDIQKSVIPVCNSKGLWGFYDKDGNKIIDNEYDNFRFEEKGKILVQKNGRWGIIDFKGKQLKDFEFKWLKSKGGGKYTGKSFDIWSLRNPQNKEKFQLKVDSLLPAGPGLFVYSMVGYSGLVDSKGNFLTHYEYDKIEAAEYGLLKVTKNGLAGVVDLTGNVVVPADFKDIIIDSLVLRVKSADEDGKWGLYSHQGDLMAPHYFHEIRNVSEGKFAATLEGKYWGFIDASGKKLIDFRYMDAEDFKDGKAKVRIFYSALNKPLDAIIDGDDNYIIKPVEFEDFSSGMLRIGAGGKKSYVFSKGEYKHVEKLNEEFLLVRSSDGVGVYDPVAKRELIASVYDNVTGPWEDGSFIVTKGKKTGIVNKYGRFTWELSEKYERIYGFNNGYSRMIWNGKHGFIDNRGNIWIAPQYADAMDFSEGYAAVKINGKWGFVDKEERFVVQPFYSSVYPYKNGAALVEYNGNWNLVGKNGKELHRQHFDKITSTVTGRYLLESSGKFGMAGLDGAEILAPKYDYIEDIGGGFVMVERDGNWGILDYNENFVIPIEYDFIVYDKFNNSFICMKSGEVEDFSLR